MPFEKGKIKTGGRRKGVANKVSRDSQAAMKLFIENRREDFEEAWMNLSNEDKVRTYLKAFEFVVPKARNQGPVIDPDDVGFTIQIK